MNYWGLALVAALAFCSTADATISCPCTAQGAEGTIIDFDCSIGEAVNLSFYTEAEPALGQEFEFWAVKEIGSDSVPAKNLDVHVILGSEELLSLTSDENGYLSFTIEEAGSYEISGGDAILSFEIEDEEPQEPPFNGTDDTVVADGNPSGGADASSSRPPSEPEPQAEQGKPPNTAIKAAQDAGLPYLPVAAAILFAIALIALLIKKNKINI